MNFPIATRLNGMRLLFLAVFTALLGLTPGWAGVAKVHQEMEPGEHAVGDPVTFTITVDNGTIKSRSSSSFFGMSISTPDISLPQVDGLQSMGQSSRSENFNGRSKTTISFILVPVRAGTYTIPAFDIPMEDGAVLRTHAEKFQVTADPNANMVTPSMQPATPQASSPGNGGLSINPGGPVTLPPQPGNAPNGSSVDPDNSMRISVPMEADNRPAKTFMVITPQTTDAYVGQTIPLRIDFYLRLDVAAEQDSLPTIVGSDFLMNQLTGRRQVERITLLDNDYQRETWVTAISAPKSGDFPLQLKRDTYWVKSVSNNNDPSLSFFFSRPNLAHEPISSNKVDIHVHSLPEDGRPANFSGAIGHLQVIGNADPVSVAVGEPVTLHFDVSGDGNFSYVRCPTLAEDPAWKSYTASSKVQYTDQSHTQGTKSFEQMIIPQKGGSLPLPPASFCYFDPSTKKYITVPIALPTVTVSGSAAPAAAPGPAAPGDTSAPTASTAAPEQTGLLPNRESLGFLHADLTPAYRYAWFWIVQGVLLGALLGAGLFAWLRPRGPGDEERAARQRHQQSLHQDQDAMAVAVRNGDASAFFLAARHALQLQLGERWKVSPEAITLGEIASRDPALAEMLQPLFAQVDEIIYSGQTISKPDLADWERRVREWQKLQPQTA